MRILTVLLSCLVLLGAASVVYGHEGEEHEAPQKVTSAVMSGSHDEGQAGGEEEHSEAVEADFQTIRQEVSASTAFIVIKALALAAAIAGIGLVYLTRRRSGETR